MTIITMAVSACAKQPSISEDTQAELRQKASSSLESLYVVTPEAKELQKRSTAILVFPEIFKAGLIVGGSGGNGILYAPDGRVLGYCNVASVSFGLQAGAQEYAQALFLMTPLAINDINSKSGGPSASDQASLLLTREWQKSSQPPPPGTTSMRSFTGRKG